MNVGDGASPEVAFGDPAGKRGIRFPEVRGRSLLGAELALPRDLPGERTLVVVAFERWQQARVDRWISRAVTAGLPRRSGARRAASSSRSWSCPSSRSCGARSDG